MEGCLRALLVDNYDGTRDMLEQCRTNKLHQQSTSSVDFIVEKNVPSIGSNTAYPFIGARVCEYTRTLSARDSPCNRKLVTELVTEPTLDTQQRQWPL